MDPSIDADPAAPVAAEAAVAQATLSQPTGMVSSTPAAETSATTASQLDFAGFTALYFRHLNDRATDEAVYVRQEIMPRVIFLMSMDGISERLKSKLEEFVQTLEAIEGLLQTGVYSILEMSIHLFKLYATRDGLVELFHAQHEIHRRQAQ